MARSRADENRQIRKDALREQLREQGHVQHVVELINKIEAADCSGADLQRYKTAAELRLKLIAKYIPDLKAIEHSGHLEIDNTITPETVKEYSIEELKEIAGNKVAALNRA